MQRRTKCHGMFIANIPLDGLEFFRGGCTGGENELVPLGAQGVEADAPPPLLCIRDSCPDVCDLNAPLADLILIDGAFTAALAL